MFLGADTPLGDIVRCTVDAGAGVVCLSVAVGSDREQVRRLVAELRDALPLDVVLLSGGGGTVEGDGVLVVDSLRDLETWAHG